MPRKRKKQNPTIIGNVDSENTASRIVSKSIVHTICPCCTGAYKDNYPIHLPTCIFFRMKQVDKLDSFSLSIIGQCYSCRATAIRYNNEFIFEHETKCSFVQRIPSSIRECKELIIKCGSRWPKVIRLEEGLRYVELYTPISKGVCGIICDYIRPDIQKNTINEFTNICYFCKHRMIIDSQEGPGLIIEIPLVDSNSHDMSFAHLECLDMYLNNAFINNENIRRAIYLPTFSEIDFISQTWKKFLKINF